MLPEETEMVFGSHSKPATFPKIKSNMKKIFTLALLLLGAVSVFTACEDDNDSNPVLTGATEFVLNEPAYSAEVIDMQNSAGLHFTWSQPNYGFPVVTNYYYQISKDGNFTHSVAEVEAAKEADPSSNLVADYVQSTAYVNQCEANFNAEDMEKDLQRLFGWEEDAVPATQTIYVRLWAEVPVSNGASPAVAGIASNVVQLTVAPYYVELKDAPIEIWYLIGGCIGDGAWTNSVDAIGVSVIPMNTVEGFDYDKKTGQGELTFTGYFIASQGFKLIKTPGDATWTDQWGVKDGNYVRNDGGSSDIKVAADGYYVVTLNTASNTLTVKPAEITPAVYPSMLISGDFNGWDAENTFMTPVNTVEGVENHVWVYELDATGGDTTVKFLQPGWQPNWGGTGFPYGVGTGNGPNIPVTAGKYKVIFNDITGAYSFIAL